jgi:hypothetical protein
MLPIARAVPATPTTDGVAAPGPAHAFAWNFATGGCKPDLAAEPSTFGTALLVMGVL